MAARLLSLIALLLALAAPTASAQTYGVPGHQVDLLKGRLNTRCHHAGRNGVRRVRTYDVYADDLPPSFEGFRAVFLTDTHYASRFSSRTLRRLRALLLELKPDALLLGGDYQEGCQYVQPLFENIMACQPQAGAYAVLGNNDYERCTDLIVQTMRDNDIRLVENDTASIRRGSDRIVVAGAHNVFRRRETEPSPTLALSPSDFVILLTHTPDYVEDQDISNTDLALAGHTHGGQVTIFGFYAPATGSHYGSRFLKGLRKNTAGQPVIISKGIGTSRYAVRLFAPSEVVLLTFHSRKAQK